MRDESRYYYNVTSISENGEKTKEVYRSRHSETKDVRKQFKSMGKKVTSCRARM